MVIVSLSIGLPLYYHYSSIHYPPVTIISYELNPEAGEEWALNITTWIPSGCYQMKVPIVDVAEKQDFTVSITIKAKYRRGMVCDQSIHTYNFIFNIIYPEYGNWTVHCNDKTITIYVQES
jgi:hypothetical protein